MFVDILTMDILRREAFPELFSSTLFQQIAERNLMPKSCDIAE